MTFYFIKLDLFDIGVRNAYAVTLQIDYQNLIIYFNSNNVPSK